MSLTCQGLHGVSGLGERLDQTLWILLQLQEQLRGAAGIRSRVLGDALVLRVAGVLRPGIGRRRRPGLGFELQVAAHLLDGEDDAGLLHRAAGGGRGGFNMRHVHVEHVTESPST